MGLENSKYLHCPEPLSLLKVFPDNRALFFISEKHCRRKFQTREVGRQNSIRECDDQVVIATHSTEPRLSQNRRH